MFVGIFGVGIMGICLYWVFGNAKQKRQTIANVLIYLWGFMLLGLVAGFVNFILS